MGHWVSLVNHESCSLTDVSFKFTEPYERSWTVWARGKVMSQGANKLQRPFLANSIYSRDPISKMSINVTKRNIILYDKAFLLQVLADAEIVMVARESNLYSEKRHWAQVIVPATVYLILATVY